MLFVKVKCIYEKIIFLLLLISFILTGCSKQTNINDYDYIQEQADEIRQKTDIGKPKIKILDDTEVTLNNGYVTIIGAVENVGTVDINNYKVIIDFADSNYKDSASTYNTTTLKVGNQQKFTITHKWDNRYKNYSIRIEYLDY